MQAHNNEDAVRAFISVPVPMSDVVERALSELRSVRDVSTPGTEIHITLRFLGYVKKDVIEKLISKLRMLNGSPSFNAVMKGVGAFPDREDPKVVWIGIEFDDPFYELLSRITDILDSMGIDYDRKRFRAHATIGRVRRNSDELMEFIDSYKGAEFGSFRVERIDVMSSILSPSGAEHIILSSIELS